jgi:hypothetical protein
LFIALVAYFIPVVPFKLLKILKTQQYGYFVAPGGGNQVVQPFEVNRWQLINNDTTP